MALLGASIVWPLIPETRPSMGNDSWVDASHSFARKRLRSNLAGIAVQALPLPVHCCGWPLRGLDQSHDSQSSYQVRCA